MKSVHDNLLTRYSVDARDRKIVFETEDPYTTPPEQVTVMFLGVQAYFFEDDIFNNILFDIEECNPAWILDHYRETLGAGACHGWPWGWEREKENLSEFVSRLGLKFFDVSSSLGLSGWVLCKEIRKE